MKTRMLFSCLLLLTRFPAGADIADWIAVSERRDNAIIAGMLRESRLQDQIAIVQALGMRKDFYLSEIIDFLTDTRGPYAVDNQDYLLRVLLSSVFPPPGVIAEEDLRTRLLVNRSAFEKLVMSLGKTADLQLRAEIVRLIPYGGQPRLYGLLLAEADGILTLLADGKVTAAQQDYILTYLLALEEIADTVFLETCLGIFERSAQAEISRTARRVIRSLQGRGQPAAN